MVSEFQIEEEGDISYTIFVVMSFETGLLNLKFCSVLKLE